MTKAARAHIIGISLWGGHGGLVLIYDEWGKISHRESFLSGQPRITGASAGAGAVWSRELTSHSDYSRRVHWCAFSERSPYLEFDRMSTIHLQLLPASHH